MTKLVPADFFVLRRPLLAINDFLSAQQQLSTGTPLATVLLTIYQDARCQEALFYASPAVHAELMAWLANGPTPGEKLLMTLYKYYVRMTTRSTPFGLFAGIAMGVWGDVSNLHTEASIKRNVRLDTGVVSQLFSFVNRQPFIRHQLTYKVNESLLIGENKIWYIGYEEENGLRTYFQNEVDADDHLRRLIGEASQATSFGQLVASLKNSDIPIEDATAYIYALIDNQILCSELSVNITGPDPLEVLIAYLSELTGAQSVIDRIGQVQALLQEGTVAAYQQVTVKMSELVAVTGSSLVQCDAFFFADKPVLADSVRTALSHTLSHLAVRSQPVAVPRLDAFKRRFFTRYELESVPLLVALNPDTGIGYDDEYEIPTPWLDSLSWVGSASIAPSEGKVSEVLLRLYTETLLNRQSTISLSTAELDTIFPIQEDRVLPASSYAMGQLVRGMLDSDPLFFLKGIGGPSAANLLGRFAHLSPELETYLKQCLTDEQTVYEGTLLAELVHLPATHTGNVLRRPILRSHEIPLLTQSTIQEQQQLPLNDLMISMAVGGQVVLHSKKQGKRIIPRLSTAHNVAAGGLAHYRFLYDLQHQNDSLRFGWDWGILKTMPFLPRVQYQNVLLSRARWYVRREDVGEELTDKWNAWYEENKVTRFVTLAEGDNELVVDTASREGLILLHQTLQRDGHATLFEWLDTPVESIVHPAEQKRWSYELLIPLRAVHRQREQQKITVNQDIIGPSRQFMPGSQWVYLKLYAAPLFLEAFLREYLPSLLADLTAHELLRSWFFIRYADPEKHLRLRFLATDQQSTPLITSVHTWVNQLSISTGRVHRVQFDTYQREIERFGSTTIDLCETWFHIDSQTVIELVALLASQPDWQRLRVGCLFIHQFLEAWQYKPTVQCDLLETWRDAFLREFKVDKSFLIEVNTLFRSYRQRLTKPSVEEQTLSLLLRSFRQEASSFHKKLEFADPQAPHRLLPHLIHLFLNRLFIDSQRRNELIVYCFLPKLIKLWFNTE
ncbi:lantibiotic dehydratase [Spirosoma spitsbergense]|uniref:lantibiotic dehydratase n=1 Tax=Spirosoma spitsbergense TaxID=431554 RepID=UPI00035E4E95|nr:lantibiotic dehydratase [Spirosoma spitsbergense]